MSNETTALRTDEIDGMLRLICWAGFLGLPVLTLVVHLLLIYRS